MGNRIRNFAASAWQVGLVAALALGGCVHPDARLSDFEDNSPDGPGEREPDPGEPLDELPDLSGEFLVTLFPAGIGQNINYIATNELVIDESGGGTLSISLQALSTTGLEPAGDPISASGVPVSAGGGFVADFGDVTIPGAANPLSGSDILGRITLVGRVLNEDLFCGQAEGAVTSPINLDLTGSTWGGQRTADGSLPAPITDCTAAEALLPDENPDPPGDCEDFAVAVLEDGGFDAEDSMWEQSSSRGISLIRGQDEDGSFDGDELPPGLAAHSPGNALWMGGSPNARDSVTQDVEIPADGADLTLSGYLWVSGIDESDNDKLTLVISRGAQEIGSATIHSTDMGATNGWTFFSTEIEGDIGGDRVQVKIEASTDGSKNTNFFIDSLQATTNVCL